MIAFGVQSEYFKALFSASFECPLLAPFQLLTQFNSMASPSISIAVVSDFACPWCLVGLYRLREAIELRPSLNFSLSWQPFQLNPDMPREGQNRREYYRRKFGDAGTRAHHETLNEAAVRELKEETHLDGVVTGIISTCSHYGILQQEINNSAPYIAI